MTQWPTLAVFSDPAITNVQALRELATRNPQFAVAATANPNFPASEAVRLLTAKRITIDTAAEIGMRVFPRLTGEQQADAIWAVHAKAPRASVRLLRAASPQAWGAMAVRYQQAPPRRPETFLEGVRESLASCISDWNARYCGSNRLPDGFGDAIRAFGGASAHLIVRAWQHRDLSVMEELLEPMSYIGAATIGIPGLADAWFDKGGKWRAAACYDLDLDIDRVLAWLAGEPWADMNAFRHIISNVRVPLAALRDALLRAESALRWPADGTQVGWSQANDVRKLGQLLDDRYEKYPFHVAGRVEDVTDPDVLTKLASSHWRADDDSIGLLTALAKNSHMPDGDAKDRSVNALSRSWRQFSPAIVEQVMVALSGVTADRDYHGELPTYGGCPECKPTQATDAAATVRARLARTSKPGRPTFCTLLSEFEKSTGGWINEIAPDLAAILSTGDAWFDFYAHAMPKWHAGVSKESLLDVARDVAGLWGTAPVQTSLVSEVLGDPLGDFA